MKGFSRAVYGGWNNGPVGHERDCGGTHFCLLQEGQPRQSYPALHAALAQMAAILRVACLVGPVGAAAVDCTAVEVAIFM